MQRPISVSGGSRILILRYSQVPSIAEAKEISTSYSKTIQVNFQYLQRQLTYYGTTIVKRWKKSREKRGAALLEAIPRIYPIDFAVPHAVYDNGATDEKVLCAGKTGVKLGRHSSYPISILKY